MNKLTCKDACLLLSLYIDDMLSDEEMTQMREHLKTCDNCRNEYTLLKGIMDKSTNLECPELSSTFESILHKKLLDEVELIKNGEEEKKQVVFPVRKYRIYPYFAACAAVVAISVLAFGNLPDSDSFITETKNEVIESVMPAFEQEALPEVSELPALETPAPATNEPILKAALTAEPKAKVEENVVQKELVEEPVALVEEEKVESDAQENINDAALARSMPMMAADMVNEESLAEEGETDAAFALEETPQIATAASGGGSSEIEKKVKISVVFSFNHGAIEQVRELMSGVTAKGSIYEVPVANLSDYINMLTSMSGYISHRTLEEDYTKKYNLLKQNANADSIMAQIEEYTNYATIIIGG